MVHARTDGRRHCGGSEASGSDGFLVRETLFGADLEVSTQAGESEPADSHSVYFDTFLGVPLFGRASSQCAGYAVSPTLDLTGVIANNMFFGGCGRVSSSSGPDMYGALCRGSM